MVGCIARAARSQALFKFPRCLLQPGRRKAPRLTFQRMSPPGCFRPIALCNCSLNVAHDLHKARIESPQQIGRKRGIPHAPRHQRTDLADALAAWRVEWLDARLIKTSQLAPPFKKPQEPMTERQFSPSPNRAKRKTVPVK
jgi:hypothetical protein